MLPSQLVPRTYISQWYIIKTIITRDGFSVGTLGWAASTLDFKFQILLKIFSRGKKKRKILLVSIFGPHQLNFVKIDPQFFYPSCVKWHPNPEIKPSISIPTTNKSVISYKMPPYFIFYLGHDLIECWKVDRNRLWNW